MTPEISTFYFFGRPQPPPPILDLFWNSPRSPVASYIAGSQLLTLKLAFTLLVYKILAKNYSTQGHIIPIQYSLPPVFTDRRNYFENFPPVTDKSCETCTLCPLIQSLSAHSVLSFQKH